MSEYKPYEERSFAMVDSTGMTMYLINEVDRPKCGMYPGFLPYADET